MLAHYLLGDTATSSSKHYEVSSEVPEGWRMDTSVPVVVQRNKYRDAR